MYDQWLGTSPRSIAEGNEPRIGTSRLNSAWRSIPASESRSALRVASLVVSSAPYCQGLATGRKEILNMDHVASCQSRMVCNHDASDHGVTQIHRPTLALPEGHQVCRFGSRSIIERSDSALRHRAFSGMQEWGFVC